MQKYDINNPPLVPTRIIDNFLTEEEADEIVAFMDSRPEETLGKSYYMDNQVESIITNLTINSNLSEKIKLKMHGVFGPDLNIAEMHGLLAVIPYRMHTDGIYGEYGIDDLNYGAYTVVIPLETCNSHTIIFDQYYAKTKGIQDWISEFNPPVLNKITEEEIEKYFTNEVPQHLKYLSIETIFPFKKGSLLAASRYKFHCSDNFHKNGVQTKKALIMWCSLPFKS